MILKKQIPHFFVFLAKCSYKSQAKVCDIVKVIFVSQPEDFDIYILELQYVSQIVNPNIVFPAGFSAIGIKYARGLTTTRLSWLMTQGPVFDCFSLISLTFDWFSSWNSTITIVYFVNVFVFCQNKYYQEKEIVFCQFVQKLTFFDFWPNDDDADFKSFFGLFSKHFE